jgi:hypothetical protein
MFVRRCLVLTLILALGIVAVRTTGIIAQEKQDKLTSDPGKLAVQFAEAKLKLAQMNLAKMKEMNSRVRGTLITGLVEQFAEEVTLAELELEAAKKTPGGNPYQATLERTRLALRTAEARAERALRTHEKAPNIVSRDDVERVRQIAVVADLQLARGVALENASPQEQLQWQMDVFSNELDRVRIYAYLLGQNRFDEFAPGL